MLVMVLPNLSQKIGFHGFTWLSWAHACCDVVSPFAGLQAAHPGHDSLTSQCEEYEEHGAAARYPQSSGEKP